jgi:hypothetical protein
MITPEALSTIISISIGLILGWAFATEYHQRAAYRAFMRRDELETARIVVARISYRDRA